MKAACHYCEGGEGELVNVHADLPTVLGMRPMHWHQACREKAVLERQKRQQEFGAAHARNYVKPALERLPRWPHADLGAPEFPSKCRSRKLRKFAETYNPKNGSVALLAASGLGKSTAAIAMVRRLIGEGVEAGMSPESEYLTPTGPLWRAGTIYWCTAGDLVRARREHGLGRGEPDLITAARQTWLLVIDEVGSEPDDRDRELDSIINERYNSGNSTLITSGLTTAEFEAKYGVALLRRLTEPGIGTKLEEFPS